MKKSQIELWMLSKFAILFFILALAAFLFIVSETEKAGLCSTEAGAQSALVANSINNVLNNPVEDQQVVVKLPSAITLGSGLSAYTINMTYIKQSNAPSIINVQTQSTTSVGCSSQKSVFFPNTIKVYFIPASGGQIPSANTNQMSLTAYPSSQNSPTRFIIIIKCTSKTQAGRNYLFVITCAQTDASLCYGYGIYNPGSTINNLCGFS